MLKTGSPGNAFVSENVRRVIPKRRGMRKSSFIKRYLLIISPYSFKYN